eukprot:5279340-Amphidinium_carterae.1
MARHGTRLSHGVRARVLGRCGVAGSWGRKGVPDELGKSHANLLCSTDMEMYGRDTCLGRVASGSESGSAGKVLAQPNQLQSSVQSAGDLLSIQQLIQAVNLHLDDEGFACRCIVA